ncbi:MAG: 23S rRNA (pseudouridine(1915)-N(3))-methyltransferase RlmH [Candidatus Egerieousia sp.]|nr:23S rRNA (pseudouridine(1915)-N(3))-methyltransferase RlmH [Candidatus Egerieousia sp.]MDY5319931.1 23S rRNA (pseudouridine(1915)-N(3))-methyltransferase RlmH [Candidatus Egerieousia sp.]
MKITLITVGKTAFPFIEEGIMVYQKRLAHYCAFTRNEIPELKGVSALTKEQIKEREGELILKNIKEQDNVVLLDERGTHFDSEGWAEELRKREIYGGKDMVFVIGGAYGFSQGVYKRANQMLSLSKMTFSHQIIRLIFMEQLYRAFTIIRGEPYHHK